MTFGIEFKHLAFDENSRLATKCGDYKGFNFNLVLQINQVKYPKRLCPVCRNWYYHITEQKEKINRDI